MMVIKNFFLASLLFCFLWAHAHAAEEPWASPVRWVSLQRYEKTITAAGLKKLLQTIYVPDGSWKSWITITPQAAFIEPYPGAVKRVQLPLAASEQECKPVPTYWKKRHERVALLEKPLADLFIVIDPGHLGGAWAKMEERWFRIGHTHPVEEGTMTLLVAQLLEKRLTALGARVQLTRTQLGPTTPLRPSQLRRAAIDQFKEEGRRTWTTRQLRTREEMLFYRTAEIYHRADQINDLWRPDLVICLHFDAEEWGNPKRPRLMESNRLHFLISGNFNGSELQQEDDRYVMLLKLLGRAHHEEVGLANAVAKSFVAATALPPLIYHNPAKARSALDSNPYLWNRNLLLTRLVQAPVLFSEAYSMNDPLVFWRIQRGDYEGVRTIRGKKYPSIYREYADAVTQGLVNYFGAPR